MRHNLTYSLKKKMTSAAIPQRFFFTLTIRLKPCTERLSSRYIVVRCRQSDASSLEFTRPTQWPRKM